MASVGVNEVTTQTYWIELDSHEAIRLDSLLADYDGKRLSELKVMLHEALKENVQ